MQIGHGDKSTPIAAADVFIQLVVPPQADALMADQHLVDGFHRRAEVDHSGIKLERQGIQRRHLVDVGGGGDHRIGAEHPGQIAAQGICAPRVAGKQANNVLAALVNHHHRRVAELVIHQRGQHAYRDPGGADEDQRRIAAEGLARGAGKTVFKGKKPLLQQLLAGKTG